MLRLELANYRFQVVPIVKKRPKASLYGQQIYLIKITIKETYLHYISDIVACEQGAFRA